MQKCAFFLFFESLIMDQRALQRMDGQEVACPQLEVDLTANMNSCKIVLLSKHETNAECKLLLVESRCTAQIKALKRKSQNFMHMDLPFILFYLYHSCKSIELSDY